MWQISLCFLFLLKTPLFGSWHDQKLEGWYYFEDKEEEKKTGSVRPEEAEEYLREVSHQLHQLLSLAILSPTQENVKTYMQAQKAWMKQSNQFSKTWGQILLKFPELSDLPENPTSSYGILAKRSLDLQKRKSLLKTLSEDHVLLLFFKGKDPLSEQILEVAQSFAETNGWKWKAISLDGDGPKNLPVFEKDNGLSKNIGVSVAPSFFVIQPKEEIIYPVGAGLIAVSELEQNIEAQIGGRDES